MCRQGLERPPSSLDVPADQGLTEYVRDAAGGCTMPALTLPDELEDVRVGQATAFTHGLQPVPHARAPHVMHERGHEAGSRRTQPMPQRDSAAARVQQAV